MRPRRRVSALRGAVAAWGLIQFVDVLAVTVAVAALPQMLADVGGSAGDAALIATRYVMFFGGLLMFGVRSRPELRVRWCTERIAA
jgi:hypothetical protein